MLDSIIHTVAGMSKELSEYLSSLSQCSHLFYCSNHLSSSIHAWFPIHELGRLGQVELVIQEKRKHNLNALSIWIKPTSTKRTNLHTIYPRETMFACESVCFPGNCVWLCVKAVGSQLFWKWSHTWICSHRERATWDNSFAYCAMSLEKIRSLSIPN